MSRKYEIYWQLHRLWQLASSFASQPFVCDPRRVRCVQFVCETTMQRCHACMQTFQAGVEDRCTATGRRFAETASRFHEALRRSSPARGVPQVTQVRAARMTSL